MLNILLLAFIISLLYISIANRILTFLKIIALQGVILFGVALIELHEIHPVNFAFILLETIVFKTLAVPLFLNYIIKRNNITREAEPYLPNFISLIIITAIIGITFLLSNAIQDTFLNKSYFVVVLSALFTGIYIIVSRNKIITHIIGYLVIDNGVFILSFAIGDEIPMLVNMGILLDLFVSSLVLGVFINKIVDVMKDVDIKNLKNLKD